MCLNQIRNEKQSLFFFFSRRSSYTCSYFVLPCCQHDFNRRFSGKAKGKSQYQTYLMYVAQVGQACGFEVEEDTLRIPSTKRVSIHGDPSFAHFFLPLLVCIVIFNPLTSMRRNRKAKIMKLLVRQKSTDGEEGGGTKYSTTDFHK